MKKGLKWMAGLLTLAMVVGSFAGCGSSSSKETAAGESAAATTAESTADTASAETAGKKLKVALILPGKKDDVSFNQAMYEGMKKYADASEIKRGHEGFKAGAKSINPDIEIQEVYTGDWTDTAGAKEAAIGMYDAGVDVIWHSGDGIGLGVVQAAAEKDMYCLGNVADQKTLAENNVLSGVVYQWDAIIANVFDDINNGTFKGRAEDDRYYWINAENNGLGIADINDPKGWLTDDDKQVIADTWSKLQSGEIKDYLPEDIQ